MTVGFLRGVFWAIGHAYRQKLRQQWRSRLWLTKRRPFKHRTARGLIFRLHPREYIDRFIFVDDFYEKRLLDFLRAYYERRPGGVALDVGANIGNHALYLKDLFKEIHCFDPNPVVVERLRDNISLNCANNISIHPVGLSNCTAELPFLINLHGDLGSSRFVEASQSDTISLPVVVGDDYIEQAGLSSVTFVKIDVEDCEAQVFEGLRRTIARHRPVVAFEYHGSRLNLRNFDQIAAVLDGYIFAEARHAVSDLSLRAKFLWHISHRGRPTLSIFSQPERRTYDNILAFPDEATFEQFKAVGAA